MAAVADSIEAAEKEILITDWQLNPHIFMKRPDSGIDSLHWRLDKTRGGGGTPIKSG